MAIRYSAELAEVIRNDRGGIGDRVQRTRWGLGSGDDTDYRCDTVFGPNKTEWRKS